LRFVWSPSSGTRLWPSLAVDEITSQGSPGFSWINCEQERHVSHRSRNCRPCRLRALPGVFFSFPWPGHEPSASPATKCAREILRVPTKRAAAGLPNKRFDGRLRRSRPSWHSPTPKPHPGRGNSTHALFGFLPDNTGAPPFRRPLNCARRKSPHWEPPREYKHLFN